jgi:hypothetical protein
MKVLHGSRGTGFSVSYPRTNSCVTHAAGGIHKSYSALFSGIHITGIINYLVL